MHVHVGELGDRCRPCEVCGEEDCYESYKCEFRFHDRLTQVKHDVCVPKGKILFINYSLNLSQHKSV